MKIRKYSIALATTALLGFVMVSCGKVNRGEYVKGASTIYCDDGFKNILEEEIDVFEYQYPESSIIPSFVSEQEAIDALMNDTTESIIITNELSDAQIKYLRDKHKKVAKTRCIAVDAIGLIVNKDNPVNQLTMEELEKIIKGEITTWSELVQNDTSAIKLVFDNQGSSTVLYMRDKFLGGKKITDNPNVHVYAEKNNAQVFDVVKNDPHALGIISVSWLGDSLQFAKNVPVEKRLEAYDQQDNVIAKELTTEVKVLGIQNPTDENDFTLTPYKPYQAYIATGDYPLFRKVYMITTASGSSLGKSFYDFMTGFVGQKIIANTGILPYHMNPRVVELKK